MRPGHVPSLGVGGQAYSEVRGQPAPSPAHWNEDSPVVSAIRTKATLGRWRPPSCQTSEKMEGTRNDWGSHIRETEAQTYLFPIQ